MLKPFSLPSRYGVEINAISPKDLIKRYDEIGFLYAAKRQVLEPYFEQIIETWTKLQQSEEELLWIQTNDPSDDAFASITLWRQSNRGLFSQHLVSNGKNPALSLKTMMAAQYKTEFQFDATEMASSQNWFRPENRYADRILGSLVRSLGNNLAARILHHYLHLPLSKVIKTQPKENEYSVTRLQSADLELSNFVRAEYGQVFLSAEEVDSDDIELNQIASMYAGYGLVKSRHIFVVYGEDRKIVGAALANRAALGINFSLLENRCYFILANHLNQVDRQSVVDLLSGAVAPVYDNFPLQLIPIVTDMSSAISLQVIGAELVRKYTQTIWLRDAFTAWHDHIGAFLDRISRKS